ncbi:MAG: hypothetical protein II349_03005, partial [Akkermansia sp.]|nr:hypothetical protein [Akkermansia sp.]
MKLRLTQSLMTLLLGAGVLSAQENPFVLTKDKADIDGHSYQYDIGAVDILISKSINFGGYNEVLVNWNGTTGGYYKVTGSGSISAGYGSWGLGGGTYEFDCPKVANLGSISGSFSDTTVVFNHGNKVWELGGIETLIINSPKFTVLSHLWSVGTIQSHCELQTKLLPGLFDVEKIEANVKLNGGGELNLSNGGLEIKGNVDFASKTTLREWVWKEDDYGMCEGFGSEKPSQEQIESALSDLHGNVAFSCESYSGKLSNLTVDVAYYYGPSGINEGFIKGAPYGCFVPVYNSSTGLFDITYKAFSEMLQLEEHLPTIAGSTAVYTLGGNDVYMKKAMNLAPKGDAKITWDASGEDVCMLGKGALSAKNKLTVELSNGTFTLGTGCSFKKADYVLEDANIALMGNVDAVSLDATDESTMAVNGGKLTVKNDVKLSSSHLSVDGALSAVALTMNGGSLNISNAKPMAVTFKGVADLSENAAVNIYGAFAADFVVMDHSTFTLAMEASDITPKNQPKAQKINLKNKNVDNTIRNSSALDIMGSMTVAGGLTLSDSTLSLHDWEEATKPKAQTLTVKGALSIADKAENKDADAELTLNGKLTAGSLTATNADIRLENEQAAQSISLTLKADAQKQAITNTLTDSGIYANGSMSVTGHLSLLGASY